MKGVLNGIFTSPGRTVAAVAMICSIAVMGNSAAAAEKVKIVTSSIGILYATAYIAKHLGYFEEQGLDVSVDSGGGGSNAVAAVVGGSSDIGMVGIRNLSQAIQRGVPMKVVATGINAFPAALVANSELVKKAGLSDDASLKERMNMLKGKTVAVTDVGGASGGFVRYLLRLAELPKDHVTLINLANNAGQLASLRAGRIDGFVNASPVWETAVANGYGYAMVVPSRDISAIKNMHFIIIGAREDYLKENRETVRKLLRAIRKAQVLIQNEPEKAKNAMFGYLESLSSAEKIADNVKDTTWKMSRSAFPATLALSEEGVAAARAFFKIDPSVTDAMLIDNSIAKMLDAE